jgi:hypothetical protein
VQVHLWLLRVLWVNIVEFDILEEVTECDQTESDKSRHYALLESDKTLFGMR